MLVRNGHTEAAVDLARLAGCAPAGVICEIMDIDGGMETVPGLFELAKKFNLKFITIKDLVIYRKKAAALLENGNENEIGDMHV